MALIVNKAKTLEDFLATDDLFVDYINVFLGLPTFPEPLCFNKDTGGFEVVSHAKKELGQKIKEALRTQARKPKIYRATKKHSFMIIPLIPMEEDTGPKNQEINTSFTVTTLNKEQGIHWVKAERLPAFLESDLYLEYRLAKLLSQARVTGEHGEYMLMKIDFKPRPKKVKKKADEEEVKVDPKEVLMKDMYVCMGNASTTETDAWYSTAKFAKEQMTTYTTTSRPSSERPLSSKRRPTSARPNSAYIVDAYNRSDSGMGSSIRSSAKNTSHSTLCSSRYQSSEADDDIMMSKLFIGGESIPATPRITDELCAVHEDHKTLRSNTALVYSCPKSEFDDSDLGIGDDEKDSEKSDDEGVDNTDINLHAEDYDNCQIVTVKDIDEIASLILGVVLKKSIETLTDMEPADIDKMPEIEAMFAQKTYSDVTMDTLDKIVFCEEVAVVKEEKKIEVAEVKATESEPKVNEQMKKTEDPESDVDSLLDSEDDYEEADIFFRKHKHRTYRLCQRKGVEQFKKFLKGTLGEKNWSLWIDIDRMHLMTNYMEIQQYVNWLREKYHKPGTELELALEQKIQLGLIEPSSWTRDKLMSVQNSIAEPLVLYWAPRFLLKQMMRTNPDRNLLYQHLKYMNQPVGGVDPKPATATLLPLRPKSCRPRMTQSEETITLTEQVEPSVYTERQTMIETSPPVGMKRNYSKDTLNFITKWQKEQSLHTQLMSANDTKSALNMRRLASAKSSPRKLSISSSTLAGSKSARTTRRPSTAMSNSSRMSIESATGRIRIKSPLSGSQSAGSQAKTSETPRLRPSSAASSVHSSSSDYSVTSELSDFFGGYRMEHLLQALHRENDAGSFFRKYVERTNNKRWVDNLNMWRDVQAYHMLFYAKSIDPYVVRKKTEGIYSKYIVIGARHHTGVSVEDTREIHAHLVPPYEELFDVAEEHAISVIHEAWQDMWAMDRKTYNKVELIDVKRHLETKSKYVLNLQKSGLIKQRVSTPDVMEGYEDPVYDEALLDNIPDEFKDYTLEKLVHNRIELEHFRNFLAENYASMDIMCWMDIEAFRRIPHTDEKKRDAKAREIKVKYLNKKYFFGPNSPAGKEGQEKVAEAGGGWGKLLDDRPPNAMILEAQKYVQDRLEKKWLPLFLVTPDFAIRQKPRTNMDDVVDDVLVQKKKKSLNMMKLLDSKWVSSSKEIIIFRKALLNPVTSVQFRRFVSIKGDSYENDVLFWLEVQKYKDMYHSHCDDSLIILKIATIINCFVESQIPPSLQIDISTDMADKIMERKHEKSPYIFREAQLVVFRLLFPLWNDFCDFRLNIADDKVLPTIERRRRHARIKERKRQQEMEEKQSKHHKEIERRIALGLPAMGEDDELFHDPFKVLGAPAESLEGEGADGEEKDKLTWTYSNYLSALEKEELLNNTDATSFTSLLTDTGSADAASEHGSVASDTKVSKQESDSQTEGRKSIKEGELLGVNGKRGKRGSTSSSIDPTQRAESRTSRRSMSDQSKVNLPVAPPTNNNKLQAKNT